MAMEAPPKPPCELFEEAEDLNIGLPQRAHTVGKSALHAHGVDAGGGCSGGHG
jgi:hypothetical protein